MTGLELAHQLADRIFIASMRPRLIAVDDVGVVDQLETAGIASMRPRLIAVDDRDVALLEADRRAELQ